MYCFIRYAEIIIPEPENESVGSVETLQTITSSKLNYSENKELLVNPNCLVQILLEYICSKTGIDPNSDYDFCNENGEFTNIKSLLPWHYATEVLQHQQIYLIIFYQKDEHEQFLKLEPMINPLSKEYTDIMLKLKRYINTSKRSSLDYKKTRRGSERSYRGSMKSSPGTSLMSVKEERPKKKRSSAGSIKNKKKKHP